MRPNAINTCCPVGVEPTVYGINNGRSVNIPQTAALYTPNFSNKLDDEEMTWLKPTKLLTAPPWLTVNDQLARRLELMLAQSVRRPPPMSARNPRRPPPMSASLLLSYSVDARILTRQLL